MVPEWLEFVSRALGHACALLLVPARAAIAKEVIRFFRHSAESVAHEGAKRTRTDFVASTDRATPVFHLARVGGFRRVFSNRPDVGGPYSVLSLADVSASLALCRRISRIKVRAGDLGDLKIGLGHTTKGLRAGGIRGQPHGLPPTR